MMLMALPWGCIWLLGYVGLSTKIYTTVLMFLIDVHNIHMNEPMPKFSGSYPRYGPYPFNAWKPLDQSSPITVGL